MKNSANTVTHMLRCMICSLLENGCDTQDVATALARLTDEANRDNWQRALETRQRGRGYPVKSAVTAPASPDAAAA